MTPLCPNRHTVASTYDFCPDCGAGVIHGGTDADPETGLVVLERSDAVAGGERDGYWSLDPEAEALFIISCCVQEAVPALLTATSKDRSRIATEATDFLLQSLRRRLGENYVLANAETLMEQIQLEIAQAEIRYAPHLNLPDPPPTATPPKGNQATADASLQTQSEKDADRVRDVTTRGLSAAGFQTRSQYWSWYRHHRAKTAQEESAKTSRIRKQTAALGLGLSASLILAILWHHARSELSSGQIQTSGPVWTFGLLAAALLALTLLTATICLLINYASGTPPKEYLTPEQQRQEEAARLTSLLLTAVAVESHRQHETLKHLKSIDRKLGQ